MTKRNDLGLPVLSFSPYRTLSLSASPTGRFGEWCKLSRASYICATRVYYGGHEKCT